MFRSFYTILFLGLLAFSCKEENVTKGASAFIGGEIINPKDAFVKLYRNGKIVDSVALDKKNHFELSIPKIKEGLYYFSHGREYQYIYLAPNDSVLLRLNTLDFDESLAFCGGGSEKNNLLIKLFLLNEKNNHKKYLDLDPESFDKKQRELTQEKVQLVQKFKSNNETDFSKKFKDLINVAVYYPEYTRKELYPIQYMQIRQLDSFPKTASSFYDFEKNIAFNNENLLSSRSYYTLLDSYFTRKTFLEYFEKRNKAIPNSEKKGFVLHKLDQIKNTITNKKVKDNLIQYNIVQYAYNNPMETGVLEEFKDYLKTLDDAGFKKELTRVLTNYANLASGEKAPKIYLHNTKGDITSIAKLAEKKFTMFYFWTVEDTKYLVGMNNRIKALKKAFPKVQFVAINVDSSKSNWQLIAKEKGLELANLYQLENTGDLSQKLSLTTLSNVIVTTPNAKIITAFENLFSPRLPHVLNLSNKR